MNTNTNTESRYVITADGIRMSYEEWIDMVQSARN